MNNYKIPVIALAVLAVFVTVLFPQVSGQEADYQAELEKLKAEYQELSDTYDLINANLIVQNSEVAELKKIELNNIEQIRDLWKRIGERNDKIRQLENKIVTIPQLNQRIYDLHTLAEAKDYKIAALITLLDDSGIAHNHADNLKKCDDKLSDICHGGFEVIPFSKSEIKRQQEGEIIDDLQGQVWQYPEYVTVSDDYFFMNWNSRLSYFDPIFGFDMYWDKHLEANFPGQPDTLATVTITDSDGNTVQSHSYTVTDDNYGFADTIEHGNFAEPGLYTITLNYTQPHGKLNGELVGKIYPDHYADGQLTNEERIHHLQKQLEMLKKYDFKAPSK